MPIGTVDNRYNASRYSINKHQSFGWAEHHGDIGTLLVDMLLARLCDVAVSVIACSIVWSSHNRWCWLWLFLLLSDLCACLSVCLSVCLCVCVFVLIRLLLTKYLQKCVTFIRQTQPQGSFVGELPCNWSWSVHESYFSIYFSIQLFNSRSGLALVPYFLRFAWIFGFFTVAG